MAGCQYFETSWMKDKIVSFWMNISTWIYFWYMSSFVHFPPQRHSMLLYLSQIQIHSCTLLNWSKFLDLASEQSRSMILLHLQPTVSTEFIARVTELPQFCSNARGRKTEGTIIFSFKWLFLLPRSCSVYWSAKKKHHCSDPHSFAMIFLCTAMKAILPFLYRSLSISFPM